MHHPPSLLWILPDSFSLREWASTMVSRYLEKEEIVSVELTKKTILIIKSSKATKQTSTALYWPYLSRIDASSVEWLKKKDDSSPALPHIIQLVKSRTEEIKLWGLGRDLKESWLRSPEELWIFSNRIKANVKSHFPSLSLHDFLLSMLLSAP